METMSPLQNNAATETYYDVQNLINKIVWEFYRKNGGEFEEWKAEANLSFVQTYSNHKKNKGQFSTWLYHCLRTNLLDYATRLDKQKSKTTSSIENIAESLEDKKKYFFSPLELLDEIQEDTKTLIHLIWNPPKQLKSKLIKNGPHPCHMQVVLRNYLFDLGWTGRRIKESFEEITRIINDD